MGNIEDEANVLCQVHSECLTGDVLGSLRCDCGQQFDKAMKMIVENGSGVLLSCDRRDEELDLSIN